MMTFMNILLWTSIILLAMLVARCAWCGYIITKARNRATFAIQHGVWRQDNFGLKLLIQYRDSLILSMDHVTNIKSWSVCGLIEDKWIPLYKHCESVKLLIVSNEQLQHILIALERAETAIKMGKSCTLEQNEGYEMRVEINTFKRLVNEAVTCTEDGKNCIIDIFSINGMSWKHQPKQPENKQILPNRTEN